MYTPNSTERFPPEHFINRELSLLQFQRRVLAQAADESVPLLERLRFLCIVSSNLDEFFEVRVSGIKEQIRLGSRVPGNDGLPPGELLARVSGEVHQIIGEQYSLLNDQILPALAGEGIVFTRRSAWTEAWRPEHAPFSTGRCATSVACECARLATANGRRAKRHSSAHRFQLTSRSRLNPTAVRSSHSAWEKWISALRNCFLRSQAGWTRRNCVDTSGRQRKVYFSTTNLPIARWPDV